MPIRSSEEMSSKLWLGWSQIFSHVIATPSSYPSSFRASDSHPVADNPGWKKNAAGFDYNPR